MDVCLVGKYQQRPVFLLRLRYQASKLKYKFRTQFGIGLAEQNAGAPLKGIAGLMQQLAQSLSGDEPSRDAEYQSAEGAEGPANRRGQEGSLLRSILRSRYQIGLPGVSFVFHFAELNRSVGVLFEVAKEPLANTIPRRHQPEEEQANRAGKEYLQSACKPRQRGLPSLRHEPT